MRDSGKWPMDFPLIEGGRVEEGLSVYSQSGTIEGRTTGRRRWCIANGCPGWFVGVRWETGQMMYPCSKGWTYDSAARALKITGGGEISARVVSPPPLGVPALPREEWPPRSSLTGLAWRVSTERDAS